MWLDNASDIDMLFYKPYAQLIANIVKKKEYNPLTIGLFGSWGAGKSTLLELIYKGIDEEADNVARIKVNAWMLEGYEDAKSALIELLLNEIKDNQSVFGNIKGVVEKLQKRVNFFKLGSAALSKGIPLITSLVTGNPIPLSLSIAADISKIGDMAKNAATFTKEFKSEYIKEPEESTIENIRMFRKEFEELLKTAKVNNMVVMVDDLDRCSPDRIIDTLEAIKLFLSVPKTTFIIATDEEVIQYAIRKKYPTIDGSSVNISEEYIEKIIQLPIYIPELSSKDIENYLIILVAQLYMEPDAFRNLIAEIYEAGIMVREESITLTEMNKFIGQQQNSFENTEKQNEYNEDMDIIYKIKSIVSSTLKGNPRQAKRFLNTFIIKKQLSQMYFGKELDMKILAKLLVLQKLDIDLFKELNEWNKNFDGENKKLKEICEKVKLDQNSLSSEETKWKTPRMIKWLQCEPQDIYTKRLDKYFYLSREVLNKNNQLIDGLSEQSKIMLEKISNGSEATADRIIEELSKMTTQVIDEVVGVLIKKIKDGHVEFFTIRRIFTKFSSYRNELMESIKIMPNEKLGMPCIPYLRQMMKDDETIVRPALLSMKDKNLKVTIYEAIITLKTEIKPQQNRR